MGTTSLAIGGSLLYPIAEIIRVYRDNGPEGLKGHWRQGFKHGFLIAVCWWAILFSYHLFYKVPHEINVEADAVHAPASPAAPRPPLFFKHEDEYCSFLST